MDKELEIPAIGSVWASKQTGKKLTVVGHNPEFEFKVLYRWSNDRQVRFDFLSGWHRKFTPTAIRDEDASENPKSEAAKGKRQYHLIPVCVLDEITDGMAEGARKYGAYNWRETGVSMTAYYDSTQRHLNAWLAGQDIDPDSGVHEISKAITSLVVLRDAIVQGKAADDRPKGDRYGSL